MLTKKKILRGVVILLGGLVLSAFVINLGDAFLSGGANSQFEALFNPAATAASLPPRLSISMDGAHAHFERGTAEYREFITLFHWCRSVEAVELAGPRPAFRTARACGALTIRYFGWPFSYKLLRSSTNERYFWLAETHLLGTHFPGFQDDGRLEQFIRLNAD